VGSLRRLEHNPSCIVLNSLQFLDGSVRRELQVRRPARYAKRNLTAHTTCIRYA